MSKGVTPIPEPLLNPHLGRRQGLRSPLSKLWMLLGRQAGVQPRTSNVRVSSRCSRPVQKPRLGGLQITCRSSHYIVSHVHDPVHCSPPGSSVHGILQARRLEWVAISFSRSGLCLQITAPRLTDLHLFCQINFDGNTALSVIQPESLNISCLPGEQNVN